jgi:hypothetical protein
MEVYSKEAERRLTKEPHALFTGPLTPTVLDPFHTAVCINVDAKTSCYLRVVLVFHPRWGKLRPRLVVVSACHYARTKKMVSWDVPIDKSTQDVL